MSLLANLPFRLLAPTGTLLTLGVIASLWGATLMVAGRTERLPGESDLTRIAGTVATVAMLDDISGSPIGGAAPGMTSIHLTLEGVAGAYRYPSGHPRYFQVFDDLMGEVALWVDRVDPPDGAPRLIWALAGLDSGARLRVTRDEVVAALVRSNAANRRAGTWLMFGGGVLLLAGWAGLGWNARQPPVAAQATERAETALDVVLGWVLDGVVALERGYEAGERVCGSILGILGRRLWHAACALGYGIGLIAVGAWLY
ncbi:MAG: hypothetical protein EXQ94_01935 [Alphaproteobacteria bacterium]|nr:hypothetical protein [Alphaproteobacteria bacterium]